MITEKEKTGSKTAALCRRRASKKDKVFVEKQCTRL
jgi:hypothetical protein